MAIFISYETIGEKIKTIHCKENIICAYLRNYSMESSCVMLVGISTIKEYISQKKKRERERERFKMTEKSSLL